MNETLVNYVNFFKDQIDERLHEYCRLLSAPMKQLLIAGQVHYATVNGISVERGHVIFRFDKQFVPRLKENRTIVIVKRAARDRWGELPYNWNCSFGEFLSKEEFHTGSSTVLPLYYLHDNKSDGAFVGCGAMSLRMFRAITDAFSEGIKIHVLFYESEPPTRYLRNLIDYIERNSGDSVLMSRPTIGYDEWKPKLLAYDPNDNDGISRTLLGALKDKRKVVLQGPPGTGKSFNAAQIIADYLSKRKSVCVTAMTNKALMELISQPPLAKFLSGQKLSKTMLSSDEAIAAKGLKDADSDYIASKGEALFATYYKISNQFRNIPTNGENPLYDLVVVEEASQAYLTTIAAALRLGVHCLVVGDPMQLAPIIVSPNKPEYKLWKALTQADGLSSFVLGNNVSSYRITTTFRLTAAAASLTGVFYGGTLKSVAPKPDDWSRLDKRYFPAGGGVVMDVLSGGEGAVLSPAAAGQIGMILDKLEANSPNASIAIITPYKDSAKVIQRMFSFEGRKLNVSVETIDRVQGATVDYTILYFPLRNVRFSFDERRFNVATSRSRTTTLILSDYDPLEMRSVTGKVREYLERVVGVVQKEPPPMATDDLVADVEHLGGGREKPPEELGLAQLQSAMNSFQVKLTEWIKGWLPIIYPTNMWRDGVVKKLSALQYNAIKANGIMSVEGLDLNELLSVFIGSFRELQSASHIAQELQTLAFHIRDIRHVNAHRRTNEIVNVDVKDIKYHIDTIDRFLAGLDKAVKIETVKPKITVVGGGNKITTK
jgi:hypothetical protein